MCTVCKQEKQAVYVAGDEDNKMGLCPICKVNYITEDETVCGTCMSESDLTEDELDALYGGVVVEKVEEEVKEDELTDEDDELEMITLGEMEGEEAEEPVEDEEQTPDPLDDFDDSLDDEDEDDEDDEDDDYNKYDDD